MRRLYFDLLGLPPTHQQVQAFSQDASQAAYQHQVDALLASPHFGERLAMHWLDLVRYADTLGYHGDQDRSVSPYRDYVIAAFNDNMPFDQFTIENLAGDLLPGATLQQRVASTYNRLNRASAEGGVQPKEYLAKYAADRVRTTGGVWLGSTIGCAECHDHKFDPFTTRDFYRFAAFFADIKELGIVSGANHIELLPVPTPQQQQELDRLENAVAAAEQAWRERCEERQAQFVQWQQEANQQSGPWVPLVPTAASSEGQAQFQIGEDGTLLVTSGQSEKDVYTLDFALPPQGLASLRLDVLPHGSLPAQGPGRASNGNFVLQRLELARDGQPVKWQSATATHSQAGYEVEHLASGDTKGWAILPSTGKTTHVVLVPQQSVPAPVAADAVGPSKLTITLTQHYGSHHTIGHCRFFAAAGTPPRTVDDILPESLRLILATAASERSDAQRDQLWQYFLDHAEVLAPQRAVLSQLCAEKETLSKSVLTTLATSAGEPRVMRVLPRGNWMHDSGEVVRPGVPRFLRQPDVADRNLNRLDLAHWIVAPDNPLTARTFVNRLWMLFFGQGLCRSEDDLGSQGQWPTHPQLLDWLAMEFIDSGWDIKHLVRLMVTSSAYRQTSQVDRALRSRDPYNELLARQSRWRLDAEMVRDNALSVSGLLVERIGGPSVKPYQPAGYWDQLNFPKRTYQHDTGESQYRRGIYTHWQRTFLHPSLSAFDAPAREECTAQRSRSNTPLQALVLLNDPTYVEAARVLADHTLQQAAEGDAQRLMWMFEQTLQRPPTEDEQATLLAFYQRNRAIYGEHPDQAAALRQVGLAGQGSQLDPAEAAAWTCVARVLLNLHETISRF